MKLINNYMVKPLNKQILLTILVLLTSSLSGCLNQDNNSESIDFEISTSSLNSTIVSNYVDGSLASTVAAKFVFNFTNIISGNNIQYLGIIGNDLFEPIQISPTESNSVELQISEHGIHTLEFYVEDEKQNRKSTYISVIVDIRMYWLEENVSSPMPFEIVSKPRNEGVLPSHVKIDSKIHNYRTLSELGGGQSVDFTWKIIDELDVTCQSQKGNVGEGESVSWDTIYFGAGLTHNLAVDYDEGQDRITVEHEILIVYPQD